MSKVRDVQFPTTRWTLVARLRSGDSETARRALDDILTQYRYTLYAYIRRRGFPHHDAEDALHDFLHKLLRARLLEHMEAARGRLRGFLGTALCNFLHNWERGERARERLQGPVADESPATDEERYENEQFSEDETAERVFDRKWGHALMARVFARLRAQCEERGKGELFRALRPVILTGGSLARHDATAIAARLGISEGTLRVKLNRHLHDYRAILEDEVLQTVEHPGDVDAEIVHLMKVFSAE